MRSIMLLLELILKVISMVEGAVAERKRVTREKEIESINNDPVNAAGDMFGGVQHTTDGTRKESSMPQDPSRT